MNLSVLSQPVRIGTATLRNRVVLAPMDRNYCHDDGTLSERYIEYLAERAQGGAALVYPEAAFVRADGRCQRNQMALDTDDVVPGLRRLAEAIHAHSSLLGVQLNHGGNTSKPSISGFQPVAPSPVRSAFTGGPVPEALDAEDIADLVEAYGDAAARSVAAGVDVVMIHAAHGYLVHQFMMPSTNQRADEYGDPARFLSDVMTEVRARVPGTPVVLRVSAFDGVENGLDEDRTIEVLRKAPLGQVDALDVSAGSYDAPDLIIPAGEQEPGWLARLARRYREFGKPVSVAGRITTPSLAEDIVRRGDADLVSIARGLHADPRWAQPVLTSSAADAGHASAAAPRPCIACNVCIDELGAGPVRCTVNPRAGRETQLPWLSDESCIVAGAGETLVVGAGPAGLETAVQLARRGLPVRLLERDAELGGQFALAARLKGYPEYHLILDWYQEELKRLGVALEFGTEAGQEALLHRNPWAVVLATGSVGAPAETSGSDLAHVVEIREWLRRRSATVPGAVLIWGGDREALAVGDDLAARGAAVTFVFGGAVLGRDVGRLAKPFVLGRLNGNPDVRLMPRSAVSAIEPHRCRVRDEHGNDAWVDTPGPLLVSQGAVPSNPLQRPATTSLPGGWWTVGDAAGHGGSVADVVHHATTTAKQIVELIKESSDSGKLVGDPAERFSPGKHRRN